MQIMKDDTIDTNKLVTCKGAVSLVLQRRHHRGLGLLLICLTVLELLVCCLVHGNSIIISP